MPSGDANGPSGDGPRTSQRGTQGTETPVTALTNFVEHVLGTEIDTLAETAVSTDSTDPAPIQRLSTLLSDAETAVGVLPALPRPLLDAADADAIGGLRGEFVLTGSARKRLRGPLVPAARMRLADEDLTLYAHDGDCPVLLLLVDDVAVVAVERGGRLPAVLVSRAPELRRWIAETCDRYRADAELLVE